MYGFFVDKEKEELTGKKALYYWKKYAEEQVKGKIKEIKGVVVSQGKKNLVQGRVRIIQ